jgi:hypothetical protein
LSDYISTCGIIQQFKKDGVLQPLLREGNANGQRVVNVTIKTITQQKLVSVAIWPELGSIIGQLEKGGVLFVEGKYTTSGDNNQFVNVSAQSLAYIAPVARVEAPVVNAQPAASQAAPAAAPAASVF